MIITTDTETCVITCRNCPETLTIEIPELGLWSDHQSTALAEAGWDDDPFTCPDCYFQLNGQYLYGRIK